VRADTRQRGQTEVNDALIGARWLSDGAGTITSCPALISQRR